MNKKDLSEAKVKNFMQKVSQMKANKMLMQTVLKEAFENKKEVKV